MRLRLQRVLVRVLVLLRRMVKQHRARRPIRPLIPQQTRPLEKEVSRAPTPELSLVQA